MMEVLVRNAEGNLDAKDREFAAEKLGRLDRYFNKASRVELVHREMHHGNGNRETHRIEVTIFADGMTVRGEEEDFSRRAAVDKAADKLESRLRRIKKRIVNKYRHNGTSIPKGFQEPDPAEDEGDELVVIKERKQFLVKPQTIDEAALEMDLLGYPFFVFKNEHTNRVEVLYKRKDGKFGLLEPEV